MSCQLPVAGIKYALLKDKYEKISKLGEGSSGKVYLCKKTSHQLLFSDQDENSNSKNHEQSLNLNIQKQNLFQQYYALKKLKMKTSNAKIQPNQIQQFTEVNISQILMGFNLLRCREIVCEQKNYKTNYYMVLNYGIELLQFAKNKEIMPSKVQLKSIIRQIVHAVQEVHQQGFIHRDIKPNNILLLPSGKVVLADFSQTCKIGTNQTKEKQKMSPNVTTRYYRAPEIIFGSQNYGQEIDIWSLGCTLAELILHRPIFQGQTDIDQLCKIFTIMGSPVTYLLTQQNNWESAKELPYYFQFQVEECEKGLAGLLPDVDQQLVNLIKQMLFLDPKKRPTIKQICENSYLKFQGNDVEQLNKFGYYLSTKKLNSIIKLTQ